VDYLINESQENWFLANRIDAIKFSIGLASQGRYQELTGSYEVFVCLVVFNATFNNILTI
jgi:hypothetical protein